MNKSIIHPSIYLVLFHIVCGAAMFNPVISKGFNILLLFIAFMNILKTQNKNHEALLWAGYVVGSEVLFRMSHGLIFHETPKYMVFLFLITGMIVEKRSQIISPVYIIYVLLLLFGIVFTNVPYYASLRTNIIFNLSGPILLGLCAMYLYKRKMNVSIYLNILKYMSLPIIAMVVYIFLKAPSAEDIVFGGVSSRSASGSYGPNQVATILGVGVFIYAIFLIIGKRISGYFLVDFVILALISYRALITLSRGGIITAVIAIISFVFFFYLTKKDFLFHFVKILIFGIGLSIPLILYTTTVSDGMLVNRYTNRNQRGVKKEDITAGRFVVMDHEFRAWFQNPFFGIGVGSGKYQRQNELGSRIASHNEMSRLLGEHGIIGLLILILLIVVPLLNMKHQRIEYWSFLSAFWIFWFLTINHSAMRLAMPSFMYGLTLVSFSNEESNILL